MNESESYLLQPLRVVDHGHLQVLQLLAGPVALHRRSVPLHHIHAAILVRGPLAALHLRQDEGVAALALLDTVKFTPPLSSSTTTSSICR